VVTPAYAEVWREKGAMRDILNLVGYENGYL
jgi:hypothetical protein